MDQLQQASSVEPPSLKRQSSQRSFVWNYFSQPVGKLVTCKECKKNFTYTGGTTNLSRHLKDRHSITALPEPSAKPGNATAVSSAVHRSSLDNFFVSRSNKPCNAAKQEEITELVVDWIGKDMRPLGIVNDGGFNRLLGYVEPNYVVPSRTTVANIVRRRHQAGREELRNMLSMADSIAVTTDAWTSKAVVSFVTYTGHFITDDWELVSCVLETSRFQGSHTAVNLAAATNDVLNRFGVPASAVACLVHDEAANQMNHWDSVMESSWLVAWNLLGSIAH